ncbi:MAG TPA: phosphoenolpyruvate--protein phosphotransferase [Deltaproteobacteria bacterium]|nr:phosphoenolpyruvate--protein phosphotransferase [Deltaproteobacteria bacterium]
MTGGERKEVELLRGIGVSSGIVIGSAYLLERGVPEPVQYCHLADDAAEQEIERFKKALRESREQLNRIKKKVELDKVGREHIRIIDAHLLILKDQMLINDTIRVIKEQKINAEWALKMVLKDLKDFFDRIDDTYLRERSADIEHTVNRVLGNLMGRKHESVADLKEPCIVVAHDLAPTDTAQMARGRVLGFLTDIGGKTSHTAIMAKSLDIPAVVGLESVTHKVETGDTVIVDGTTGTVIVNPSRSVLDIYRKRRERYARYGRALHNYKDLPSETTDGRYIKIMGNLEIVEEMDAFLEHGAEGIGLYRTEFLYLNRRELPTEQEHLTAYKEVAGRMAPHPVVIRTLDIGGDKLPHSVDVPSEMNPAMGLRAIRFCLRRLDIFKTQLRAILRASAFGKIRIMFPMISGVDELRRAKEVLEEVKQELRSEGVRFDEKIEVGAMIEVPAAAAIADLLAREVDFFSIGTNDLLQYSLAIDRVNEHVAYLYEPFHPAVLRTVKGVVDAAREAGIDVGVCGEMAGEPESALIFVGFGIDRLSMNSFSILRVKKLIRSVSYADARLISEAAMNFSTAREVEAYISSRISSVYRDELWA